MLDPSPDVNIPKFFLFDSTAETLSLPEGKVLNVNSLCNKAIFPPTTSARQAARVLGLRRGKRHYISATLRFN